MSMQEPASRPAESNKGYTYRARAGAAARLMRRLTRVRMARPARLVFDRPALSVCFDDFPRSAATLGAALLERYGGRGTYYASAGLADIEGPHGRNFNGGDLARLAQAGHEIGCHTYAHADCARRKAYDTLLDLAQNRDAIAAMGVTAPLQALAYPYGETSYELKATLPARYLSARGTARGLNVGRTDLAQLRAYPMYGEALDDLHAALRQAVARNAWLIVYTHDVADAPSAWGVTPKAFEDFLVAARKAGLVSASVTSVLQRAQR